MMSALINYINKFAASIPTRIRGCFGVAKNSKIDSVTAASTMKRARTSRRRRMAEVAAIVGAFAVTLTLVGVLIAQRETATADENAPVVGSAGDYYSDTDNYANQNGHSTLNDILGAAQRFGLFAENLNLESNSFESNLAAKTFNVSQTTSFYTRANQTYFGNAITKDVTYIQSFGEGAVAQEATKLGGNSAVPEKLIVGADVDFAGSTNNDGKYYLGGQRIDDLMTGNGYQDASATAPYINFDAEFEKLNSVSDKYAQNKSWDLSKGDGNDLTIDLNDYTSDQYVPLYSVQLKKKDDKGFALPGARYALHYCTVAADGTVTPGALVGTATDDTEKLYDANGKKLTQDDQGFVTDDSGQINLQVTSAKNYCFVEVAAPNGYELDTTPHLVKMGDQAKVQSTKVITISAAQLFGSASDVSNLVIKNVPYKEDDVTVVINVDFSGADTPYTAGVTKPNVSLIATDGEEIKNHSDGLSEYAHNHVLWNFTNYDTSKTIYLPGDTMYGTILAPNANLTVTQGNIWGSVIAKTVNVLGTVNRWDLNAEAPVYDETNSVTAVDKKKTTEDTTQVTVKKKWLKADGKTALTVADDVSVTADVYGSNSKTKVKTVTLNNANQWTATVAKLPVKDADGKTITYSAKEVAVSGSDLSLDDFITNNETSKEGSTVTITNTQHPTPVEPSYHFDITKTARDSQKQLSGAEFTVYTVNGDSKTVTTTDDVTATLQTATPGTIYLLQESKAPAGYQLNRQVYAAKLSTKGVWQLLKSVTLNDSLTDAQTAVAKAKWGTLKTTAVANGFYLDSKDTTLAHFTMQDAPTPTNKTLQLKKIDANDSSTELAGAEFTLTKATGSGSGEQSQTRLTNQDGLLVGENKDGSPEAKVAPLTLVTGETYTLQETKAPAGYTLATGSVQVTVDSDGKLQFSNHKSTFNYKELTATGTAKTIDGADFELQVTNTRNQGFLPHTGSDGPLRLALTALSFVGLAVFLFGLAWIQNRKEVRS